MAVKKSISRGLHKCPHCDLVVDFPVGYCTICNSHRHTLWMGDWVKPAHPGICTDCYEGKSVQGLAWRRKNRTWRPNITRWPTAESDSPEWYDMMQEWKCSTLQEAWLCEEPHIEEF